MPSRGTSTIGQIDYRRLLDIFWHNVDPLDGGGQFCDRGTQYRSAIFYAGEDQRQAVEESAEAELDPRLRQKIATRSCLLHLLPGGGVPPGLLKDPVRYHSYREGCGRDRRLRAVWGRRPEVTGEPTHAVFVVRRRRARVCRLPGTQRRDHAAETRGTGNAQEPKMSVENPRTPS